MKSAVAVGSSLALFFGLASAQSYDATVCGEDRHGEFSDLLVYLPNAWNDKSPDDGYVCMSVDDSSPSFDVTWKWPKDIADVHSYPYVRINHQDLAIKLSDLESMQLSSNWIMTLGSPSSPPRDFSSSTWDDNKEELEDSEVTANAAWDFFLDGNKTRTFNPVDSAIEVMIWLGKVGNAVPLLGEGVETEIKLGDHTFQLHYQLNFRSRHVFTWIRKGDTDINEFDEDVAPLFKYILDNPPPENDDDDAAEWPEDPWLGIVEFGSETWFSNDNVTFSVSDFAVSINGEEMRETDNNGSGGNGGSGGDGDGDSDDDEDGAMALGVSALAMMAPIALIASAVFGL